MSGSASPSPLDIVYLLCHSKNRDREILYSLRSVDRHLPFVRKVWIFGDRPGWLRDDKAIVEHVPHEYMAPLLGFRVPVRNDFLMLVLASLIPGLAFDFVRFSDDYVILQTLTRDQLCTYRALEDLNRLGSRGKTKFKHLLWRTYDILKRYGYAGYNFEAHVPQPLTKLFVFEAYMAFRQFQSEERYGGMVSGTAICNYAIKHHRLQFIWMADEKSKAGFHGRSPSETEVADACRGKLFLNFDDPAWGPGLEAFLAERFPEKSKYER